MLQSADSISTVPNPEVGALGDSAPPVRVPVAGVIPACSSANQETVFADDGITVGGVGGEVVQLPASCFLASVDLSAVCAATAVSRADPASVKSIRTVPCRLFGDRRVRYQTGFPDRTNRETGSRFRLGTVSVLEFTTEMCFMLPSAS